MKHVPLVVADIVAVEVELESAHPVAVPPVEIAYVTEPFVEPPEVDMVRACEYGLVFDVGLTVNTSVV